MNKLINFIKSLFINSYDDNLIQQCISDYWGLKTYMLGCKSKAELTDIMDEVEWYDNAYYGLVPHDLLDKHITDLETIYKDIFHTLA